MAVTKADSDGRVKTEKFKFFGGHFLLVLGPNFLHENFENLGFQKRNKKIRQRAGGERVVCYGPLMADIPPGSHSMYPAGSVVGERRGMGSVGTHVCKLVREVS